MVDLYEQYENIYNEKTKNYFEEVLSSYNNKNYRSAVVHINQPFTPRLIKHYSTKRIFSQ